MDGEDNINLRVASFSYYLDTAKDNLVQRISAHDNPQAIASGRLAPSTAKPRLNTRENVMFKMPGPVHEDPTTAFSFQQQTPYQVNFERTKSSSTDGEIRVFGADKYFNNIKPDYKPELLKKINSNEYKNELPPRPSSQYSGSETQSSIYSETGSWASQTGFLQCVTRRLESELKQKKSTRSFVSFFPGFSCHGPCTNKKAVDTSEKISLSGQENQPVKNRVNPDPPRESLEVFGSQNGSKGDIAKTLERKLSMLTWDAIPIRKQQNLPTSTHGSSTICDDLASDASSDLFEIENISGNVYPLLKADQETDNTSVYAPSEASIEWSVMTASAADYSFSDYDEKSVSVAGDVVVSRNAVLKTSKMMSVRGKETQKSKHGGLLGCKNHKAVDVTEVKCKSLEKMKHLGLDLSPSEVKPQARSWVKDF